MLNNTVLDVAIGLIFIYMLYSLLATSVKEFIATLFSYRSRMLERGLEQMLDGRNYSYYWWDKVANWYLYIVQIKKINAVASAVKTDNNFEKKWWKRMKVFNSRNKINNQVTDKPASYIKRAKLNKKAALFAANISNHPLYKRTAENSLFFKKPAYMSADTFSDILLDNLSTKKSTAVGTPVLMKDIADYVKDNLSNNPELKKILGIYVEQANGDLQRFKLIVENWFDETMSRVSGWYKKQATRILLMIGFAMALVFNIGTIDIIKRLSESKAVRDAVVMNATRYVDTHIAVNQTKIADTVHKDTSRLTANASTIAKADSSVGRDSVFKKGKQQLEEIKKFYKESVEENSNLLGLGWGDYGYTDDTILYRKDLNAYNKAHSSFLLSWKWKSKKTTDELPGPSRAGKVWYILSHGIFDWTHLIGFLVTAFAISLGAPFWFDLLNKFINLRVSGAKPEDSRKTGADTKTPGMNQQTIKPDPRSFG